MLVFTHRLTQMTKYRYAPRASTPGRAPHPNPKMVCRRAFVVFLARIVLCIATRFTPLQHVIIELRGGSPFPQESVSSSPQKRYAESHESSSLHDARGYIAPNIMDIMLLDMNHTILLKEVAEVLEVKYLGPAKEVLHFPVNGILFGHSRRVMVNFSCRRKSIENIYPWFNVIFLCDTGSPNSYISVYAMNALICSNDHIPELLRVDTTGIFSHTFHLSIPGSHFSEVNVLGMDFLCKAGLSTIMDPARDFVELRQNAITSTKVH
jgi:hypothetical protein